jgi:hypothetical protein
MSIWSSREEIVEQIEANKTALMQALSPNNTVDGDSVEYKDPDKIRANLQYLKRELDAYDGNSGPVAVQGKIVR